MIKAVIFDFFGVLVGDGFDSTYRLAGGNPEKDHDFIEALLERANRAQITSQEFRAKICERIGITPDEYQTAVKKAEKPNHELLDYIKDILRPDYKIAILSNVNKGGLEKRLSSDALKGRFDAVIVSGEVGYIKPEPEIYHMTAEKLGVGMEECIFVDDREPYIVAAQKLGMKTILYKNFEQMKTELEKMLSANPDD